MENVMHVIIFEKVGISRPAHERTAYEAVAPVLQLMFHVDREPTAWDLEKYSDLFIESQELQGKTLTTVWLEDGNGAKYVFGEGGPGNMWVRHIMETESGPEVN